MGTHHVPTLQVRILLVIGRIPLNSGNTVETISGYPALIEVTLEELETGLESDQFTSVDLVNVRKDLSIDSCNTGLIKNRPIWQESKKSMVL